VSLQSQQETVNQRDNSRETSDTSRRNVARATTMSGLARRSTTEDGPYMM
jgi:hypothetical protein